jgi:cytoskeletal protein CcmA (bactofilin family)
MTAQYLSHTIRILTAATLMLLALPLLAGATMFEAGEKLNISPLHTIDDDLIAWVSQLNVDGTINGDLIAGGYNSDINGTVGGSASLFAYQLRFAGRCDGSLRVFANLADITGYVGRSLLLFGSEPRVSPNAVIEGPADIYGATVNVEGTLRGPVRIGGGEITITATIEDEITIKGDRIDIYPPAVIIGTLTYTTKQENDLVIHPGATVTGEVVYAPATPEEIQQEDSIVNLASVVLAISKLLAAFLFGIILLWLFRKYAESTFQQLRSRFTIATASGFVTVLIAIVSVLILLVALVFSLVGLIMIEGEMAAIGAVLLIFSLVLVPVSSFAAVTGGLLFYTGKVMFAFLLGWLAIRLVKKEPTILSRTQLFTGLIILTLLMAIPYIGTVMYLLASIIGLGGIVLGVRHCYMPSSNDN